MRYFKARAEEEMQRAAYRFYISDSLYAAQRNMQTTKRFRDIIRPAKLEKEKTADEIALDVIRAAGLEVDNGRIRPDGDPVA